MNPYLLTDHFENMSSSEITGGAAFTAPVTPSRRSKDKLLLSSSSRSMMISPGGSVGSTGSSGDDSFLADFERLSPGRSKSALARLQTIREKRVRLTSPLISPTTFARDVFGESPTSLNAWEEEDDFGVHVPVTPQRRQKDNKSPGNNHPFDQSMNHHRRIDGLRKLLAEFDIGA